MKLLLALCICLCASAQMSMTVVGDTHHSSSGTAITLCGHIVGPATPGSNGGVSGAISITGGCVPNFGVILMSRQIANNTVSDSQGHSWTQVVAANSEIQYTANTTFVNGQTFTVSSSGGFTTFEVLLFSNVKTSPYDGNAAETPYTATTTCSVGISSPGTGQHVVVAGVVATTSSTTYAVNSSFSVTDSIPFNAGVNFGGAASYLVQAAGAGVTPAWSFGTSNSGYCNIVSFAGI